MGPFDGMVYGPVAGRRPVTGHPLYHAVKLTAVLWARPGIAVGGGNRPGAVCVREFRPIPSPDMSLALSPTCTLISLASPPTLRLLLMIDAFPLLEQDSALVAPRSSWPKDSRSPKAVG